MIVGTMFSLRYLYLEKLDLVQTGPIAFGGVSRGNESESDGILGGTPDSSFILV